MHWTHWRPFVFRIAGGIVAVAAGLSVGATVTLQPVSQERGIHGMVIVPPCDGNAVFDDLEARGFDPFDESMEVSRICDFAHGIAGSRQVSTIGGATINGFGQAECNVFSVNNTIIHSIPSSNFDLTFDLTAPVEYEFTGTLIVEGGPPVVVAYARLRFSDSSNAVIIEHFIEPGPNGERVTFDIDDAGVLPAGTYRMQLEAVAAVDSQVPPWGVGYATFDGRASFRRPGDITLDGTVGVPDLLEVINQWGACEAPPTECSADIAPPGSPSGDGTVGVLDLLMVLNNWG